MRTPARAIAAQRKPRAACDFKSAGLDDGPGEAALRKCCAWPHLAFNFRYLARIKF